MTWFDDVPSRIKIARDLYFVTAAEAVWHADAAAYGEVAERSSEDFGGTAVLLMARLQLDEMVEVLRRSPLAALGMDWADALALVKIDDDLEYPFHEETPAFDLACVEDALPLRDALQGSLEIEHGYASDGSIVMTIGPEIPADGTFCFRGSDGEEMNDSPVHVLDAAVFSTRAAARLCAALEMDGATAVTLRAE